jgi:hypothetical protein
MKLTKQSLRQMIREAVEDVTDVEAGRVSDSSSQQQFRKRSKEKNAEVSPQENSLIQQVLDAMTTIAAAPDVELGRHRPQISVLLKKLQSITGAELGGEVAPEEEEQLEEGATRFDPEPRREPQQGEIEIMKGRGAKQKWFYVSGAEDAKTLVKLGRSSGFPTGIIQNLSGEQVPQGYSIREER